RTYEGESDVLILTGDLDMLQLVSDSIHVAIMRKGQGNYEVFSGDNFYEKKDIYLFQFIVLNRMLVYSEHNYTGDTVIGEKTGIKLSNKYGSIDQLLEKLEELTPAMQKKFTTDLDMLHLSKQLAEIKCDVPISCPLETSVWAYDEEKVRTI